MALKEGLSSGVKGTFDPRDGLGERLRDRRDIVEEVRLLEPEALF